MEDGSHLVEDDSIIIQTIGNWMFVQGVSLELFYSFIKESNTKKIMTAASPLFWI